MKQKILIKNARMVNEGKTMQGDLMIEDGRISKIDTHLSQPDSHTQVIDAAGRLLIPGVIDDQVHFREPGLTHKGTIYSESRAAAAGGVTSYIEQPNTIPQATTHEKVQDKYTIAAENSLVNYAFNFGATNDNLEEIKKIDPLTIPGVKVFMGSSTGNMLVDELEALEGIFSNSPVPIITHCEDEATIIRNLEEQKKVYGDDIPMRLHQHIRSREACFKSSSMAVELAKKHDARLHVYHISTKEEVELFDNKLPLVEKKITAEACIHHLWFDEADYETKGALIKWNPAVKTAEDKEAILGGILDGRIDVIATDHAPHTLEEKNQAYTKAPSGGPLVQHGLLAMMEYVRAEKISIEQLVEKMCHNPAILFNIKERGFLREGYYADLVLLDASQPWTVNKENILYHCGWSPFDGFTFKARVLQTFVNGKMVWENGKIMNQKSAMPLAFNR